jgi:predicted translin family RNA/ssDNA-binding protein
LPSPTTVEQAATQLTMVVREGVTAGEVDSNVARDIEKEVAEALREVTKGDPDGALEKLEKAHEKIDESLEEGKVTSPERAEAIDTAIDVLGELIATTVSGDGEEGDGDD